MELVSSSTLSTLVADLSANVSSAVDSVWVIALLAVSIPLTFYIVKRVIGLFPKSR